MKIAVIDDDQIFQFLTCKLIEKIAPGYELLSFKNGQDALEFIQTNLSLLQTLPELILLDINMPILDGWQFLDHLIALNSAHYQPIIYMVSSSIDQADLLKSRTYVQVKGYLTKPLSKQQITELLNP
ncbi:response regulator receiver domain-containing protein [Larkinella arboricola]|uniref:Response regulator receiver domain-containing protein n=1 Tax=Larkinella arboricola TaxID=643671 RepID=A0A327WJ45_LARAB|nr:response regulator [Larkinella arboricola]RAJ90700.1 response regulator receiver domain-containing protein [Larkinella arboricola]